MMARRLRRDDGGIIQPLDWLGIHIPYNTYKQVQLMHKDAPFANATPRKILVRILC